jgi:hypothetical protein
MASSIIPKALNGDISSLNDALSNNMPKVTGIATFTFRSYSWTRSAAGMYYTYVEPSTFFPNVTFNTIFSIEITNFASLRNTDWFIPFVRNGATVGCMCPVNAWSADNSGFSFRLVYK